MNFNEEQLTKKLTQTTEDFIGNNIVIDENTENSYKEQVKNILDKHIRKHLKVNPKVIYNQLEQQEKRNKTRERLRLKLIQRQFQTK